MINQNLYSRIFVQEGNLSEGGCMTDFFERKDRPIKANVDFRLEYGDELICRKGFSFTKDKTCSYSGDPVEVRVLREYDRFILVEVTFNDDEKRSYRECINKASYIEHSVDFIKKPVKVFHSPFQKDIFLPEAERNSLCNSYFSG